MEATVIKRILNQEEDAKREFIHMHHLTLKKVILKYAGHDHHEDILQETWIKIFTNLHTFQFKSKLLSWMIRIAINTANTYHRKQLASIEENFECFEEYAFKPDGHWKHIIQNWSDTPEEHHQGKQLKQVIDNEIMQLPESQKAVLLLHDTQGYNFEEICNILDISQSNVRVLLHRARQQLMLKVDNYYGIKQC